MFRYDGFNCGNKDDIVVEFWPALSKCPSGFLIFPKFQSTSKIDAAIEKKNIPSPRLKHPSRIIFVLFSLPRVNAEHEMNQSSLFRTRQAGKWQLNLLPKGFEYLLIMSFNITTFQAFISRCHSVVHYSKAGQIYSKLNNDVITKVYVSLMPQKLC